MSYASIAQWGNIVDDWKQRELDNNSLQDRLMALSDWELAMGFAD